MPSITFIAGQEFEGCSSKNSQIRVHTLLMQTSGPMPMSGLRHECRFIECADHSIWFCCLLRFYCSSDLSTQTIFSPSPVSPVSHVSVDNQTAAAKTWVESSNQSTLPDLFKSVSTASTNCSMDKLQRQIRKNKWVCVQLSWSALWCSIETIVPTLYQFSNKK